MINQQYGLNMEGRFDVRKKNIHIYDQYITYTDIEWR